MIGVDRKNRNKKVIFKIYATLTDFISKIKSTEIDHAKDIDIVMPMYNSMEYSGNYSKTFGTLRQFYRDEPALNNNRAIINFPDDTELRLNVNKK